jgi:hypothetical protein
MINTNKIFNTINFSLMVDELLDHGATYASVTLLDEDGKAYYSKCSSDDWLLTYMDSGLYKKCHLMTEANKQLKCQKTGFTFLWDNYFPKNEESLYLDKLRQEKSICHGVAFCNVLDNGKKSIITVTGKHADVNFSNNVLRNKKIIYNSLMKSFSNGVKN